MEYKNYKTLEDVTMYIATQFVNVPRDEFEAKYSEALELIGKFLDVDRVYVFDYDFDLNLTSNTFEWCNLGVNPEINNLQNISIDDLHDEWVSSHKQGQMVIYEDVKSLDPSSAVYQILEPQGVLSICTVPLMYMNECLGFVGYDDVRNTRKWIEKEFKLLKVLAELMVNLMIKKKNDDALIFLRDQAQLANEAKGKFLAQMSHEIRTPLNGIYNSFYLLSKTSQSNEQKEYLEIAKTSLDALSSIVNNILDLSKIEAGKMSVNYASVDLEAAMVKLIKSFKHAIKSKNLKYYFRFDYAINYEVIVDIDKINQILMNLINNALKFTDEGYIKVQVERKIIDDSEFLSFSVVDTGIGIKEHDLTHILEAFYQVPGQKTFVPGTGLGLAIINDLVNLLGGHLSISSEFGKGSTFEFSIPLSKGEEEKFFSEEDKNVLVLMKDDEDKLEISKALTSMGLKVDFFDENLSERYFLIVFDKYNITSGVDLEAIKERYGTDDVTVFLVSNEENVEANFDYLIDLPVSRKSIMQRVLDIKKCDLDIHSEIIYSGHVLIVDDNNINREALQMILRKHGLTSDLAGGGVEAVEMAKKHDYDLILMDIQMPQMDGYEASRLIRSHNNKGYMTPIIAVTANAFLSEYDVKMSNFIDDVIYKPFRMENVIKTFDKYLNTSKEIQVPNNLLTFNVDSYLSIFDQNLDTGLKMISAFQIECFDYLDRLKEAVATANRDTIYKALHSFKGPLSYTGGEKLIYLINELMGKVLINKTINKLDLIHVESELKLLNNELKRYSYESSHS